MIAYLKGTLLLKTPDYIILEVQGVGYKVFTTQKTHASLGEGKPAELFCYLYTRENSMELYGFSAKEELEVFEIVNKISGIGPHSALQVASLGSLEALKKAVSSQDETFFAGIHRLGTKKIQKIILELTGKLKDMKQGYSLSSQDKEVLQALVSLGFPRQKAKEVLPRIPGNIEKTEERIKAALKILRE